MSMASPKKGVRSAGSEINRSQNLGFVLNSAEMQLFLFPQ